MKNDIDLDEKRTAYEMELAFVIEQETQGDENETPMPLDREPTSLELARAMRTVLQRKAHRGEVDPLEWNSLRLYCEQNGLTENATAVAKLFVRYTTPQE